MTYRAEITIMPHEALLDPQGKAVSQSMPKIGLPEIKDVRVGKHISLQVEADTQELAREKVSEACRKLLVNAITEYQKIEIFEVEPHT